MLQPLLSQSPMSLLKQVAKFAERRQEVLAGNIANIDSPGYRMRDLPMKEFQAALRAALSPEQNSKNIPLPSGFPWTPEQLQSPGLQSPGLMDPSSPSMEELFPETLFQAREANTQPGITFQDANNRSIEHQFLEMTKNSLLQNYALQIMTTQYSQLQAAISGQV